MSAPLSITDRHVWAQISAQTRINAGNSTLDAAATLIHHLKEKAEVDISVSLLK